MSDPKFVYHHGYVPDDDGESTVPVTLVAAVYVEDGLEHGMQAYLPGHSPILGTDVQALTDYLRWKIRESSSA